MWSQINRQSFSCKGLYEAFPSRDRRFLNKSYRLNQSNSLHISSHLFPLSNRKLFSCPPNGFVSVFLTFFSFGLRFLIVGLLFMLELLHAFFSGRFFVCLILIVLGWLSCVGGRYFSFCRQLVGSRNRHNRSCNTHTNSLPACRYADRVMLLRFPFQKTFQTQLLITPIAYDIIITCQHFTVTLAKFSGLKPSR